MSTVQCLPYLYIYTHIYCIYIYIYAHTYIHTYVHTYIRTYIHAILTYTIHTHIHHAYIHIYIHTYTHTYIRTYIHTYTHTDRHWFKHKSDNCITSSHVSCLCVCLRTHAFIYSYRQSKQADRRLKSNLLDQIGVLVKTAFRDYKLGMIIIVGDTCLLIIEF